MTAKLRISRELALPADAVTETFAILAKRGAGKTYTAAVLVEELARAGMQFVVVDPIGVWWGLRSSADGKSAGIPVIVPLEVAGGTVVADLVVDEGLSVVLDLGQFRKGEQIRFMTDFCERLYHRNRSPLHLVLDEADAFAPQKPRPEGARLLGAVEDLVRRGRARGVGVTLVTQRSAVLNKDVLTQAEVLVALRTTHPRDRDAIGEWAKAHGTAEQLDEMMSSLAGLPIGEAYFWSPGWLDVFQRVRIRKRETFDSSATPKVGEKPRAPRKLADVDLDALRDRMAATIERAKADDPRELRKKIAELERQLKKRPTEQVVEERVVEVEKIVEVSAIAHAEVKSAFRHVDDARGASEEALRELNALLDKVAALPTPTRGGLNGGTDRAAAARAVEGDRRATRPDHADARPPRRAPQPARREEPAEVDGDFAPSGPQQRILNALGALEEIGIPDATKTQLAFFAGASPKSSSYTNNLGALRTAGLIAYPRPARVCLTDHGRARADVAAAPTTTDDLHQFVYGLVGPSKARLLRVLIDSYPDAIAKPELAEAAGASASSSSFTNNRGSLRSLGLIDYPGPGLVTALPVLFLEGS